MAATRFRLEPLAADGGRDGVLLADAFAAATAGRARLRAAAGSAAAGRAAERALVLTGARLLDVVAGEVLPGTWRVCVRGGVIESVAPCAAGAEEAAEAEAAVVVHCGGATLMPGLCDAHVHATACSANLPALLALPESLVAARAARILGGMLSRGFTTVRDAGGADFGLAAAVEEGAILGPRVLFTGHALSQTGGHGDMRGRGEDGCIGCGAALRGIGRVCDGEAEVRRAARDELRKGAHCVKVMASGGVASPTDRRAADRPQL
jgi:imidazolonepropionase-like amidohydrolase